MAGEHECEKEDRIRDLEIRMGVVETKVDDIKKDIKDIKDGQRQLLFWMIGTMATVLITLFVTIINLLSKGGV